MTYIDLLWHLQHSFDANQLDSDVTIQQDNGEFFPVDLVFQQGDDILDDNHPYLAAKILEEDE